jgi:hypothetical protein
MGLLWILEKYIVTRKVHETGPELYVIEGL